MKKIRKAFTLIEMVIVLFIISLLLLIMIPNLAAQRNHANTRSEAAFRTTLITQAQLYVDNNPTNDSTTTVSLDKLEKEKYISPAQVKRAKEMGYKETDNILDETIGQKQNVNS